MPDCAWVSATTIPWFTTEEREHLQPTIDLAVDIVKSFVLAGVDVTMNQYNKLGKTPVWQKQTKQEF